MKTIADIQAELRNLKRKMWRAKDSHDRRGLIRAKVMIRQIANDIESLQDSMRPTFRRSYKFESFIEDLLFGRKVNLLIYW